MPTTHRKILMNSKLGIYFSIFASTFVALFMVLLILQQLGTSDILLRMAAFIAPILIFIAISIASYTKQAADFFSAGRRVPAVCNGLILSVSALGGCGLIIFTGLLFIDGFDAWCIPVGMMTGFVVMATMVAPFYRKYGAYTVPSYLGRRFESKSLRIAAATIFAMPVLLLLTAELTIAIDAINLLTGLPKTYSIAILGLVLGACIALGGMQSLSSVGSAQAIAVIIAMIVPAALLGVIETNLPIAQLSYGPVLRTISRMEIALQIPVPEPAMFAFDLAGQGLTQLQSRLATPYSSLGPASFALTTMTVMLGIACAPWLLLTNGATAGVHEARKSFSWTILFFGIMVLTLSALAVFLRNYVMLDLIGKSPADLPEWFTTVSSLGQAAAVSSGEPLKLSDIAFDRDGVLFAIPVAAGFPPIVLYLILAGVISAALVAAAVTAYAFATMLSEDILLGLEWRPISTSVRLASARVFCIASVGISMFFAVIVRTDPLQLLLWALSLSAATAFPVIMLSIWWRKMPTLSALSALIAGFVTSIIVILSGDNLPVPLPTPINGLFGMVAALIAAFVSARMGSEASQQLQEKLRDIRIPGGETIYDRELRLLRLKEQQRSK